MIDVDTITINNKEYIILKEIINNNNHYCYLSNINDNSDIMIKKIIIENNEEYFINLTQDEFYLALNLFIKSD